MHAQPSSHDLLQRRVLQAVMAGTAAVVLLPFAQADTASFGWLPLWLVGMPLAAWWSLRGFPVPALAVRMPRRRRAQASRRTRRARHDLQQARQA